MTKELRNRLLVIAKERLKENDPSHDILHTLRVLANAEKIADEERADLDIVIPAALFHDLICHPKDSEKAKDSAKDSAVAAEKILLGLPEFPKEKIEKVKRVIESVSFRFGVKDDSLESQVVNDADLLDAAGLVAAMRTFGSCGSMGRPFYNIDDPFNETERGLDEMNFGLDHFYSRLLVVKDRIKSKFGKEIAVRRTAALEEFLEELKIELEGK